MEKQKLQKLQKAENSRDSEVAGGESGSREEGSWERVRLESGKPQSHVSSHCRLGT